MKFFSLFLSFFSISLFLLPPLTGLAQDRSVSRDEAIRMAFSNRADLKAARIEIDRAASRAQWSGRMDNPTFDSSIKGDRVGQREGERETSVALSQSFPITARLKHEKNLRRHQILLAEAEFADRCRAIAGEIDRAIIDLLATQEKQKLSGEGVKTNEEIVSFMEKQSASGEVSKLDSMQAKLSAKLLSQEKESLRLAERQQKLELLRLVGLSPKQGIRVTESMTLPKSSPSRGGDDAAVLKRRPDYALALAKIDEAKAALVLENAKRWEDITVSLMVEDEHSTDFPRGMDKNTFAGFGISIPLPLRQRNQEAIAQAKLDGDEAARSAEAARFAIQSECESAYQERYDAWELAREAAKELPELAQKQLTDVRKAYESGEATFLQVRQAQEQVVQARRAALDFLINYYQAEARVREATGAYPSAPTNSRSFSK